MFLNKTYDIFYYTGQVCDSENYRIATLKLFMSKCGYIKKIKKINFKVRENFYKKTDVYIVQGE